MKIIHSHPMNLSPHILFLAGVCAGALSATRASADVRFGPVLAGVGQSVRLVSHTTTLGGTVKLEKDGHVSTGTILYSRPLPMTTVQ